MTDEPTFDPPAEPPEPGEPANEAVPSTPILRLFRRAPILSTGLTIRAPSHGQVRETGTDVSDNEIDDREFAVRVVKRQLEQDQPIEEVRAWPDYQLLAGAGAYLSVAPRELGGDAAGQETGDPTGSLGDEIDDAHVGRDGDDLQPLTFPRFRDEIKALDLRRAGQLKELIEGISALATNSTMKFAELMKADPAFSGKFGLGIGHDLGQLSSTLARDSLKGLDLGKLGGLGNTSKIGVGLSKLLADRAALEKFVAPKLQMPTLPAPREPLTYIAPTVRPEIGLLAEVGDTLEKMRDDQLRTADHEIVVMVEQTKVLKDQGDALSALVHDAKGQKWPRRLMLGATIIAACAAVAAALYAGGIIRPFGAATYATPAPIVSPAVIAPSPTVAPTPTVVPDPSPAESPSHSVSPSPSKL